MKPLLLLTCGILLSGCVTPSHQNPLVGTWKHRGSNWWFRFYADGKAATWDDHPQYTGYSATWIRYDDQHSLYFHDIEEGWVLRGSTLVVQEPAGEEVFDKLSIDLEPPR